MTSAGMVVCASHTPGMLRDKKAEFGHAFRAGVAEAAAGVAAFAPELVVFFGSDHRRGVVGPGPAVAGVPGAGGTGALAPATGRYDVPAKIAAELAGRLLDRDFDITVGRDIALDHGFGQTYEQLIGSLPDVPVIPVYINCATPPLGRPGRAFALGRAVGEELSYLDQRVLFIGSGGLSHSPPSLVSTAAGLSDAERLAMNEAGREAAMDKISPEWDKAFLRRIAEAPDTLERLTPADIEPAGVGANEVRTWIAAIAAGSLPMETVVYEPVREWITGMAIAASR